ncbi:protein kinase domain-containing protein [Streptomyces sp. NPDC001617]
MGEVFAGRYELVDPIGRGGVGAVWRAWDHRRRRYVAAKVLQQRDAHSLLRFVREQALRIDHPHVLAPASWAADDDQVLFTMDLVAGGSLVHLVGDYGPLPPAFVCTLLDQLLSGLAAVHAEDVVHRDIKPANVLLEATGTGRPRLRLSDFGIAMRLGEPRLTETNLVVGTPGYLAPEQMLGAEPDFPADLFAVGLVALYLLEGAKPDAKALIQYFAAHGTPGAPKGIPEPLWQVVASLLQPDPEARFRTATGARKALAAAAELLPEPGPDDESIEIFDQLGPLPPGFVPEGPLKRAPGVGVRARTGPTGTLPTGMGTESESGSGAGPSGSAGLGTGAGSGAGAGSTPDAGAGDGADASQGAWSGTGGGPSGSAGWGTGAGPSGQAGSDRGAGSGVGAASSAGAGWGMGAGPSEGLGSGVGAGFTEGSGSPLDPASSVGAEPPEGIQSPRGAQPSTGAASSPGGQYPMGAAAPHDPHRDSGPLPEPHTPTPTPSMSDTGSFHLPPPQATASSPRTPAPQPPPQHPHSQPPFAAEPRSPLHAEAQPERHAEPRHQPHAEAQPPEQVQAQPRIQAQGQAQAPIRPPRPTQPPPAHVSPYDPTHVLPSPRTMPPVPHHLAEPSTASYTAQVPQVPHPAQEIPEEVTRRNRRTGHHARRPGPPAKVAIPLLLLALACYAVGFWALTRI